VRGIGCCTCGCRACAFSRVCTGVAHTWCVHSAHGLWPFTCMSAGDHTYDIHGVHSFCAPVCLVSMSIVMCAKRTLLLDLFEVHRYVCVAHPWCARSALFMCTVCVTYVFLTLEWYTHGITCFCAQMYTYLRAWHGLNVRALPCACSTHVTSA
jgi:hypothetical protein